MCRAGRAQNGGRTVLIRAAHRRERAVAQRLKCLSAVGQSADAKAAEIVPGKALTGYHILMERRVVEGMDDIGGGKMVKAYVPLAEMFGYSTDLRSRTQGRGNYSMFFEKYEQVPKSVQDKIISSKDK